MPKCIHPKKTGSKWCHSHHNHSVNAKADFTEQGEEEHYKKANNAKDPHEYTGYRQGERGRERYCG